MFLWFDKGKLQIDSVGRGKQFLCTSTELLSKIFQLGSIFYDFVDEMND